MQKVAIVTDSVACLPVEFVKKYDIKVAPVQVIWDRVTYRDGVDLTADEFYKRLRTAKRLPTTTSAIQGDYIQIFQDLRGKAERAIVIPLTGDLGASYSTACTAATMVPDMPVEVIDSRTAMMAQGFIVLEAAKAAAQGGSFDEVLRKVKSAIPKAGVLWMMDTLDYLRRGGRVGLPQAVLASWLKVKPITAIIDGKVSFLERVRTTPKACARLVELLAERTAGKGKLHLAVLHGDAREAAASLLQQAVERLKPVEMVTSEITPVIGTHTGPGTLGFCYYCE